MNEKRLKFNDCEVNKKEFHAFKRPITLKILEIDKTVVSDQFERSSKYIKYFIGYEEDNIIIPLCISFTSNEWILKMFW